MKTFYFILLLLIVNILIAYFNIFKYIFKFLFMFINST